MLAGPGTRVRIWHECRILPPQLRLALFLRQYCWRVADLLLTHERHFLRDVHGWCCHGDAPAPVVTAWRPFRWLLWHQHTRSEGSGLGPKSAQPQFSLCWTIHVSIVAGAILEVRFLPVHVWRGNTNMVCMLSADFYNKMIGLPFRAQF